MASKGDLWNIVGAKEKQSMNGYMCGPGQGLPRRGTLQT